MAFHSFCIFLFLQDMVLCRTCPKIAALYEADNAHASLKAYMDLVQGAWLKDILTGNSARTLEKFVGLASSQIELMQKSRSIEVLKQMAAIMDGLMDGSCQGLKPGQVQELCSKMSAESPYFTFISNFLTLGTLGNENAPELLAAVTATGEELTKVKSSTSPDMVAAEFGSGRLQAMEDFLASKRATLLEAEKHEGDAVLAKLSEEASKLSALCERVDLEVPDEKAFVQVVKPIAAKLGDQQKATEAARLAVEKFFKIDKARSSMTRKTHKQTIKQTNIE